MGGETINYINSPIYNALRKYVKSGPISFHMPGHKFGKGIPDSFLKDLHLLDMTEIPGLDNLHFPNGVIKEAQELAARAFGADYTSFLVNGSTCGVHAAIMSLCRPGDKLIVARDCHKSVISGMMLAGVKPVYVRPEYDGYFGVPSVILPSKIEEALINNPDAVGVLITRPNYYGICSDIVSISNLVHYYNKTLIVDEAHGAHLKFSSKLPDCAMDACADICIQSAHKTLTALTQGAYMHVKGNRVDIEKLRFVLHLIQTTSPSYVIMSFLDIARAIMDQSGSELIDDLLDRILWLESMICENTCYKVLSRQSLEAGQVDNTRIVINVRNTGKTGFNIDNILRSEYNIQVEMSDLYNIVCIATIADAMEDFENLYLALTEIDKRFKKSTCLPDIYIEELKIPSQVVEIDKVIHCQYELRKITEVEGRISRGVVTPYPPGVPVICPGEAIARETIRYLVSIIEAGGTVNGISEGLEIEILKMI